ncbi:MAG: hypothetical protein EOP50_09775, partial [Sphingobacteriales bacterium]
MVKLQGADYITLRTLTINSNISSNSNYAYGVQLLNGAEHNRVVQCSITVPEVVTATPANNFSGIVINSAADNITGAGDANCNYNVIDSNTVKGGYHGISIVADGAVFQVKGNEIKNNSIFDFFNSGVYLNGNNGTLVINNDIARPNRAVAGLFYGVQLYNISRNVRVEQNRIHTPFGGTSAYVSSGANGIYMVDAAANAGEENIVANNAIYDFKSGSVIRGIWLGNTTTGSIGSSYNKIIHNTISLDDEAYSGFGATTGIESSASAQNVTIQNNIISMKRVGSTLLTRTGMNIPSTNNTVNHNNVYLAPGGTTYIARWGSSNCATINDWQAVSGDATSVSEDAGFPNAAGGNLLPGNSALQTGAATSVTGVYSDINGLGRNNIPTIGAFEIGGVPLAVQFAAFSGNLHQQGYAHLQWQTASETNN